MCKISCEYAIDINKRNALLQNKFPYENKANYWFYCCESPSVFPSKTKYTREKYCKHWIK